MSSSQGRQNGKKTIYSSNPEIKHTTGVYHQGSDKRKELRFNRRKKQRRQFKIWGIVAFIIVVALSMFIALRKDAEKVYLGDEYVGMLKKSKVTAEDFVNTVTAQLAGEVGTNVKINEEIKFVPVHGKKKEFVTPEYALSQIKQMVTYKVEAAVITVDGAEIMALATQTQAKEILDGIIAEYIPEGSNIVESGFVEKVETITKFVDSEAIVSKEEAVAKLTDGTSTTKDYAIASGDTLFKIATKNSITVEDVLAANPGMTVNTTIMVGSKINLKVMVPFISVKTAENTVFTEKQEKEIEYRQDNTKPVSYKKVIQQGKDGQKEVTTQIIRINGFESEQKTVSETITVEPVTEIIVVGTK
ncbi:MAG: G5 domain-containing protein [Anaerotignaceae bacterium]